MESQIEKKHLTKEQATEFFAELFYGEHHLPGKIKEWGFGWCINTRGGSFSTFDYNNLTRLVIMAHDKCIRAEVRSGGQGILKICIWQRQGREGKMYERHPTIETAISNYRGSNNGT